MPLSSKKELFALKIPNVKVKRWPENQIIAYANWGTDKVAPEFSISEGATVQPAMGKEQGTADPIVYTVTAEDGSIAKYTLIVCQVSWAIADVTSPSATSFHHFGQNNLETWSASAQDSSVWINFEQIVDFANHDPNAVHYDCMVGYKGHSGGITTGSFPVVLNSLTATPGSAFAWLDIYTTSEYFSTTVWGGNLNITQYDAAHQTISGSFDNIQYKPSSEDYPYQVLFGNFINLPVQQ